MSIQSEINRIKSNVAAAYAAAQEKGASMPSSQNSANLAAAISSITGGAGIVTFSGVWTGDSISSIVFDNIPENSTPYNEIRSALTAGNTPQLRITNSAGDWEAYFHLARDGGDYEGFQFTVYERPTGQNSVFGRFGVVYITAGDARYFYEEHRPTIIFSAQYNSSTKALTGLPSYIYTQISNAYYAEKNVMMKITSSDGNVKMLPLTGISNNYFTFSAPVGYIEMMSDGASVETASMSIAICSIFETGNHYYERPIFDV